MAYEVVLTADNGNKLHVQWSDDGCWDYTFYDEEGQEIDGGQLGNDDDYEIGADKFAETIIEFHDEIPFDNYTVDIIE